jgi:hypothetical protein
MNFRRKTATAAVAIIATAAFLWLFSGRTPLPDLFGGTFAGAAHSGTGDKGAREDSQAVTKKPRVLSPLAEATRAQWESIRQQEREAKANGTDTPTLYKLFGKGGELTEDAAKAVNLTATESKNVENIMKTAWEEASSYFMKNTVIDETKTDLNQEKYVYNIKAAPDRGASILKTLKESMNSAIGKDRQKILMKGFQTDDALGGFGYRDITIEILPREGMYKYKYRISETGSTTAAGSGAISKFKDIFGDTFDFSKMKIADYKEYIRRD